MPYCHATCLFCPVACLLTVLLHASYMSHWTVLLYVTRQSRLLQLGCYKQYGSTVSSGVGPHHMRAVKRFREHLESSCNTSAFCAVETSSDLRPW